MAVDHATIGILVVLVIHAATTIDNVSWQSPDNDTTPSWWKNTTTTNATNDATTEQPPTNVTHSMGGHDGDLNLDPTIQGHTATCQHDPVNDWACNGQHSIADVNAPGVIHSPLNPAPNCTYLLRQECRWRLVAPEGAIIRVEFTLFDLEDTFTCFYAEVTLYDGDAEDPDDEISNFCGRTLPPVVHSGSRHLVVLFMSGDQGHGHGFQLKFDYVDITAAACDPARRPAQLDWPQGGFTTPGWPLTYPLNSVCSWIIKTKGDVRLHFPSWELPEAGSNSCHDYLTVYDGPSNIYPKLGVFCGPLIPDPLGKTHEEILLEFRSDGVENIQLTGFQARYVAVNLTDVACGTSRPAEIDWQPGHMDTPNTADSKCLWRFRAPIGKIVRWESVFFDLPDCSNCGCASLTLYDGEYETDEDRIGSYCRDGWADDFLQSGGNSALAVYESYRLAPHAGFQVKFTFFDVAEHACSSERPVVLTHRQGLIVSPNYGTSFYPRHSDCQWLVQADHGQIVVLNFLSFQVQMCPACQCDRLSVWNGADPTTATRVLNYCGRDRPLPVMTTEPAAYLAFFSDGSDEDAGFRIQYDIMALSDVACESHSQPAVLYFAPGKIMSPGYSEGVYPDDAHCRWIIRSSADTDLLVKLEFTAMEIYLGRSCEFDRLDVYDGDSEDDKLLARLCGSDLPPPITASTHQVLLVFTSDDEYGTQGFVVHFDFVDPPDTVDWAKMAPIIVFSCLGAAAIVIVIVWCRCGKAMKRRRSRPAQSPLYGPMQALTAAGTGSRSALYETEAAIEGAAARPGSSPERGDGDPRPVLPPRAIRPPSYRDPAFDRSYIAIPDYPPPTYQESLGHPLAQIHHVQRPHLDTSNRTEPEDDEMLDLETAIAASLQDSVSQRSASGGRDRSGDAGSATPAGSVQGASSTYLNASFQMDIPSGEGEDDVTYSTIRNLQNDVTSGRPDDGATNSRRPESRSREPGDTAGDVVTDAPGSHSRHQEGDVIVRDDAMIPDASSEFPRGEAPVEMRRRRLKHKKNEARRRRRSKSLSSSKLTLNDESAIRSAADGKHRKDGDRGGDSSQITPQSSEHTSSRPVYQARATDSHRRRPDGGDLGTRSRSCEALFPEPTLSLRSRSTDALNTLSAARNVSANPLGHHSYDADRYGNVANERRSTADLSRSRQTMGSTLSMESSV